ncbi:hypothetical protein ACM55H_17485 [Flavobacterium sp. ZT3R17]|uniref:hypothetical protein n=1 Tax=Flavobacterium cryoconiti TaxID=3398736 RepID=UPI003A83F971
MRVNILHIEEKEFKKLNVPTLFNDNNTSRCYATINYLQYSYKFSWQSDIIQPKETEIKNGVYAIGIDQNFAIIDFNINAVILNLRLDYLFCDTKIFKNFIYLITELEIIKIDIFTLEKIKEYALPDIFEEINFDDKIRVNCFENSVIYLD